MRICNTQILAAKAADPQADTRGLEAQVDNMVYRFYGLTAEEGLSGGGEMMRIYLDNCSLNRPYDDQTQVKIMFETEAKLFIQQEILARRYELAWSYVLDYEIGNSPFSERKDRIILWKNIACLRCIENESILLEAEKLQKIGLKVVDSLHIACANFMKCDYVLTTDRKMLNKPVKRVTQMPVLNPLEFIQREVLNND